MIIVYTGNGTVNSDYGVLIRRYLDECSTSNATNTFLIQDNTNSTGTNSTDNSFYRDLLYRYEVPEVPVIIDWELPTFTDIDIIISRKPITFKKIYNRKYLNIRKMMCSRSGRKAYKFKRKNK